MYMLGLGLWLTAPPVPAPTPAMTAKKDFERELMLLLKMCHNSNNVKVLVPHESF